MNNSENSENKQTDDGKKKVIKFGSSEYWQLLYWTQKKKAGSHEKPPKPKGKSTVMSSSMQDAEEQQRAARRREVRQRKIQEIKRLKQERKELEAKEKEAALEKRKSRERKRGASNWGKTVSDKYKNATMREAVAVATWGKLARTPLAQAELDLRKINAFVATYEANTALLKGDLLSEARLLQLQAEETFRLAVAAGHHKMEAYKARDEMRALVRECENRLYAQFEPEKESPYYKEMLKLQKVEQMRRDMAYQSADRSTRQRVKDLLSKERPVDDPRALNLLTMVKAIAVADALGDIFKMEEKPLLSVVGQQPGLPYGYEYILRTHGLRAAKEYKTQVDFDLKARLSSRARKEYILAAKLNNLLLSDPIFKCPLDPAEIDAEGIKAGKGRTATTELIRKAASMGIWLSMIKDDPTFGLGYPHPCRKCGEMIEHSSHRVCDQCYVQWSQYRYSTDAGGRYMPMINWGGVSQFIKWPRGIKEEASWQAADKAERRLADMAAGLIEPGDPSGIPVREQLWEFGPLCKFLPGWKEAIGRGSPITGAEARECDPVSELQEEWKGKSQIGYQTSLGYGKRWAGKDSSGVADKCPSYLTPSKGNAGPDYDVSDDTIE